VHLLLFRMLKAQLQYLLRKDSLVLTNKGLRRIGDLSDNREEDSFSELLGVKVISGIDNEWKCAMDFYYGGKKRTMRIVTKNGFTVEGTPNHKIKVMSNDGSISFKRLDKLQVDDYCPIVFDTQLFGNIIKLPSTEQSNYGNSKVLRIPEVLTERLSNLLGIIVAGGNYGGNDSVVVTHSDKKILFELNSVFQKEFNVSGSIVLDPRTDSVHKLTINSRNLVKWMQNIADIRRGAANKVIPSIILNSTKENIAAFLSGLFFDGYLVQNSYQGTKFGICLDSESIIRDLQILFANLCIISNIVRKYNSEYDKYYHEILVYGDSLFKLKDLIVLREDYKQIILTNINTVKSNNDHLGLPEFVTEYVSEAVQESDKSMNSFIDKTGNYRVRTNVYRGDRMKLDDVLAAFEYFGYGKNNRFVDIVERLKSNRCYLFQKIVEIKESEAEVFDIYVPDGNAFVANGLINHNTVNLTDCVQT